MVFLWGKKVINLCVVEGTPFCGTAAEGWVTLKAYVPERFVNTKQLGRVM